MGTKEKLIARVKTVPADLMFSEMEQFLGYYGYTRSNKGRTSGSRVAFYKSGKPPIMLHRPHNRKCLLKAQIISVLGVLDEEESL